MDNLVLNYLVSNRTPGLNGAMLWISEMSSPIAVVVMVSVIGLLLAMKLQVFDACWLVLTTFTGQFLCAVLKRLIDRPRPPMEDMLVAEYTGSLPSQHVTGISILLVGLLFVGWKWLNSPISRIWAVAKVSFVIMLVAIDRLYLGVHYLTDVLGAFVLSALVLSLAISLYPKLHHRRVKAVQPKNLEELAAQFEAGTPRSPAPTAEPSA